MNQETSSGAGVPSLVAAMPLGDLATSRPDDPIQIDSCLPFQWIVVRTRSSVYDIIVLPGDAGDVMVRGGHFFPEFQRANIVGSIFGGIPVRSRSISVGCHMELQVNGKFFVTSRIEAVSLRLPH